PGIPFT
ncbi:hypothetical protein MIMGU_mgv1a0242481mg, partial [Erythranthe guttata]